jgi:hypothetical protein
MESDTQKSEERDQETAAEQMLHSAVVEIPQQALHDQETVTTSEPPEGFSLRNSGSLMPTETPIAISLLKRVRVQLIAPNGVTREVKLRRGENSIRLIMLAYIAWRKREPDSRQHRQYKPTP